MSAKTQLSLGCDLCKWPAKVFADENAAHDEGWLKIGQESYFDDRSFFDTWVCPSCVKKIKAKEGTLPDGKYRRRKK